MNIQIINGRIYHLGNGHLFIDITDDYLKFILT
jgi:hypothetical protein